MAAYDEIEQMLKGPLMGTTLGTSAEDAIRRLFMERTAFVSGQVAEAANATYNLSCFKTEVALRMADWNALPGVTVAQDDTDYATIALVYNDGAGGSDTTLGSFTSKTTGGVALTADRMTADLSLTTYDIPAGSLVAIKVTKAAAGKVTKPIRFQLRYRLRGSTA